MAHTTGRGWLSVYLFFDGWIYTADCDRIVVDVAEPFVRRALAEGWIDQHFFIRYSEFGPHVRLRMYGEAGVLEQTVWPALVEHVRAHSPAVQADARPADPSVPRREEGAPVQVTHLQRVEYEPETERYGGPHALLVSERAFQASSDAAYALIAKMGPERSSRLGKGLLSMVVLVHLFAGDRDQAAQFVQMYSTNYLRAVAREEGGREALLDAFDQGFSQQSETLMEYVDAIWEAMDDGDSLSDTLDAYVEGMRAIREELRALFQQERVQAAGRVPAEWAHAWQPLVPSYLHMMNNRLGITIQEESYLGYLVTRALGRPAEALRTVPEPAPRDG
jgi:thiopeptide-type bacteriocin biosynthesis protein